MHPARELRPGEPIFENTAAFCFGGLEGGRVPIPLSERRVLDP